jgi:hypothetical protein
MNTVHVTRERIDEIITGMVADYGYGYVDKTRRLIDYSTNQGTCFLGVLGQRLMGHDWTGLRRGGAVFDGQTSLESQGFKFSFRDATFLARCMRLNDAGCPWGEISAYAESGRRWDLSAYADTMQQVNEAMAELASANKVISATLNWKSAVTGSWNQECATVEAEVEAADKVLELV